MSNIGSKKFTMKPKKDLGNANVKVQSKWVMVAEEEEDED